MKVLEKRTHFPSHVVRLHPKLKGDEFHRAFDRWLEGLK